MFCLIKYLFPLNIAFGTVFETFLHRCGKLDYICGNDEVLIGLYTAIVISVTIIAWILMGVTFYCYMVCNDGETRDTALKLSSCITVTTLTIMGMVVLIVYFADRDAFNDTRNGESSWITDIALPILFLTVGVLCCWRIYKNWKKYHFWTTVSYTSICFVEAFYLPSWRIDEIAIAFAVLVLIGIYLEFQHLVHHGVTCIEKRQYKVNVVQSKGWKKECLIKALIGQFAKDGDQII